MTALDFIKDLHTVCQFQTRFYYPTPAMVLGSALNSPHGQGEEMENMIFTDINGKPFVVDTLRFYGELKSNSFKLFGFDMPTLIELRRQYMLRSGPLDSTPETVREAFQREV